MNIDQHAKFFKNNSISDVKYSYDEKNRIIVNHTLTLKLTKNNQNLPFKIYKVQGNIIIHGTSFNSLLNFPEIVEGSVYLSNRNLTTLKHGPKYVGKDLFLNSNKLKNLNYFPKYVGGHLDISNNKIKSLKKLPKGLISLNCSNTLISSLTGIPFKLKGLLVYSTKLDKLGILTTSEIENFRTGKQELDYYYYYTVKPVLNNELNIELP